MDKLSTLDKSQACIFRGKLLLFTSSHPLFWSLNRVHISTSADSITGGNLLDRRDQLRNPNFQGM